MAKVISIKFPDGEYRQISPEIFTSVDFDGENLYVLIGNGFIVSLKRDSDGTWVKYPLKDQKEYDRLLVATLKHVRSNALRNRNVLLSADVLPPVISESVDNDKTIGNVTMYARDEEIAFATDRQEPPKFDRTLALDDPILDYHLLVPILITDFENVKRREAFHRRGVTLNSLTRQNTFHFDKEEGVPSEVYSAMRIGKPHQTLEVIVDGRKNPSVDCYDRKTGLVRRKLLLPAKIRFILTFYPSFNEKLIDDVNDSDKIDIIEESKGIEHPHMEPEIAFSRGMLEQLPVITDHLILENSNKRRR